jgi:hypothetical protein
MVSADVDLYQETSAQFIGRWNHLISTSNWEKGRIISQWRASLADNDAPAAEYSDEAWSRRVGGVSPQHVGRLRRVYDRFDEVRGEYEGLYWSHFHAALDWEDAEMWLEGGVQNGWSVKQMMNQRWETLGSPADSQPTEDDIVSSEVDEDIDTNVTADGTLQGEMGVVEDTTSADEGYDEEDEDDGDDAYDEDDSDSPTATTASSSTSTAPVRPFESLPSLPEDVQDAMEAFKLSIVRHKLLGWEEFSQADMLACLDALKTLTLTPAEA